MHGIIRRLVARLSARAFIGPGACRNDAWVNASITYTENVFATIKPLRVFPSFLRPFAALFLSSYWRVRSDLATARRVLIPMIVERRRCQANDPKYEKPKDYLQWMMDIAKPNEAAPQSIAHRQLVSGLGSLNTTTTAAVQTLYDICDHPEYFEPLREEILSALTLDGGWDKTTINKLHGFDSFMKESQRVNPPSYCKPLLLRLCS